MEGWLNQIQSFETLWPDYKTLTLNELLCLFTYFVCYSLLNLKRVFILQREVWNERVNVCVWNVRGMCVSKNTNQFHITCLCIVIRVVE